MSKEVAAVKTLVNSTDNDQCLAPKLTVEFVEHIFCRFGLTKVLKKLFPLLSDFFL